MAIPDSLLKVRISCNHLSQESLVTVASIRSSTVLFSFPENAEVFLQRLDESWEIDVETCGIGEKGGFDSLKDEPYCLNNNSFQRLPLFYKLRFKERGSQTTLTAFFNVTPLSSAASEYDTMLAKIGEWYRPALYEENTSKIGAVIDYYLGRRFFHRSALENIYKERQVIAFALSNIFGDPYETFERSLERTYKERKPSLHAILRNERKGPLPEKHYISRMVLRGDDHERQYLKFLLESSYDGLKCLLEWAKESRNKLEDHINKEKAELKKATNENKKSRLSGSVTRHEEEWKQSGVVIEGLFELADSIRSFLRRDTLPQRTIRATKPLTPLSQPTLLIERYLFLPLHRNYYCAPFSFNLMHGAPIRPTFELFEIYSLVILLESLKEMGCVLIEEDSYQERSIDKQQIEFLFKEYRLILAYGNTAKDAFSDSSFDSLVFVQDGHISPDFYLAIFDGDSPKNLLIIDSKCRRFSEIVKTAGKNDRPLNKTVRSYASLRYKGVDGCSIGAREVWLLSPEKTEAPFNSPSGLFRVKPLLLDGIETSFKYDVELSLLSIME